jgi:hypothetical protein
MLQAELMLRESGSEERKTETIREKDDPPEWYDEEYEDVDFDDIEADHYGEIVDENTNGKAGFEMSDKEIKEATIEATKRAKYYFTTAMVLIYFS